MAKTEDPDYVSGTAPPYKIQPPIVHPPFCVCTRCSALPLEERGHEHVFRVYRVSPVPKSRVQTAAFAIDEKKRIERELREAVTRRSTPGVMRLRQVCDLYFAMNPKKVSAATILRDQISAGNLCRITGDDVAPGEIDEPIVVRFRNEREEEGASPRTISNEMSFLKMVLAFGLRWQRETGMTEMRLVDLPEVGETEPTGVALSIDEIGRILSVARPRERRMIIGGITTMLRRRPLMAMQRPWLDFDRAWLSVPAEFMKKGRARRRYPLEVPVSAWTVEVLRGAPSTGSGYLWPNVRTGEPIGRVFQILDPLAAMAKVRPFSMHDLRTTGATLLRQADVDELVIAILLGHRSTFDVGSQTFHAHSPNVTRGYTKLFEPTLREAVAVFDDLREKLQA